MAQKPSKASSSKLVRKGVVHSQTKLLQHAPIIKSWLPSIGEQYVKTKFSLYSNGKLQVWSGPKLDVFEAEYNIHSVDNIYISAKTQKTVVLQSSGDWKLKFQCSSTETLLWIRAFMTMTNKLNSETKTFWKQRLDELDLKEFDISKVLRNLLDIPDANHCGNTLPGLAALAALSEDLGTVIAKMRRKQSKRLIVNLKTPK